MKRQIFNNIFALAFSVLWAWIVWTSFAVMGALRFQMVAKVFFILLCELFYVGILFLLLKPRWRGSDGKENR
jgi:hypothetical protein